MPSFGMVEKEKEIIPIKYDGIGRFFGEGLVPAKVNEKWGFIDKKGKEVLPFKYDFAYKFSSGLACVEIDKKRGFIDKTGKVVIPIIYDETGAIFDNDEMEVEKDGRKFYIDKTGKEIE
ncbi:KWG Leptospira [Chryseobacterium sp. MOF25P]|jgi:hypothetical protein|nr:KWG Leptospira [Chryseobacterium sp. MOF25P]OBW46757.1 KWG Leptospira [Chryseobacterium sp. BGARF1]